MTTTWRTAEANRELNRDKQIGRRVFLYGLPGTVVDADDSGYVIVESDAGTLRWVGLDHLES